jgi:hypothetical protein
MELMSNKKPFNHIKARLSDSLEPYMIEGLFAFKGIYD